VKKASFWLSADAAAAGAPPAALASEGRTSCGRHDHSDRK
jgi:hypothetical protein